MTLERKAVGAYGERCAVRHLVANGLRVVDRNWRTPAGPHGPAGEIDIIAWDGPVLAFCEVKTRRGATFGSPAEAVVPAKARRLRRLAAQWLEQSGAHPAEVRFDVVSVFAPPRGPAQVEHLKGAF
ncbi:YraN family protein [Micromonospora sp. NBC_01796]|uniref:YraN family protein n=1 Tax=Micromonospora sp. NBC_01796 TaxID=2975987 RepID=UPI002DDBAFB2|nr:YraN family protein [Micromonospora sp. NBC_01796]WSA87054.1 YraN family protein [Micromonospora sp. NBC_01796]